MIPLKSSVSGGIAPSSVSSPSNNCPHVFLFRTSDGYSWPLSLRRLDASVQVCIVASFVELRGTFVNMSGREGRCAVHVPLKPGATVTGCQVRFNKRLVETAVVPIKEARRLAEHNTLVDVAGNELQNFVAPPVSATSAFVLPFGDLASGDEVTFSITYFERLHCDEGAYVLSLPLTFDPSMIGDASDLAGIVNVNVSVDTGGIPARWGHASHSLECIEQSPTRIRSRSLPTVAWPNGDFSLSYTIWNEEITSTLLVEEPVLCDDKTTDPRGSFCVIVTPPESMLPTFNRSVVFVVDRSGSMGGPVAAAALQAIRQGVDALAPGDLFNIIAFNEFQFYFKSELVPVTDASIAEARAWIDMVTPDGLTDIFSPLRAAVRMLTAASITSPAALPFIFLVTDGAVLNERDICVWATTLRTNIRINTFGIGAACNQVFLKVRRFAVCVCLVFGCLCV